MEFFGQSFLDGSSLFEIVVILVLSIHVSVYQGFHGDDSASAAEIVFVLNGHARLFDDSAYGRTTRFVSFSVPSPWTWGAYEGGFHGERVVGGEFFVGVEFGRERLEISV